MQFIVAQSFMKQLKRLTEREQGMVSNAVLGLQYDPTAARRNLRKRTTFFRFSLLVILEYNG